jgi:polysaccharide biosynthesis/export protein
MKMQILLTISLLVFCAIPTLSSQDHPENTTLLHSPVNQSPIPALSDRNQGPRYRIGAGDVLELTFPFTPEFNQTVAVQPDGFGTFREVGDLLIGGKTVPELRELLTKSYQKILHEPEIKVDLKDFEKPYFITGGEVHTPGRYELRGTTTVMQAIALAGGMTDGGKSQVLVFRRRSDDWVEVRKVNVNDMLKAGMLKEDIALRPGDMVYVPKNMIARLKGMLIPKIALGPTIRPGL